MTSWRSATIDEVEIILLNEFADLHPAHQERFNAMRVSPYKVPVKNDIGFTVVVVAEYNDKILYWSDIEDGWELVKPNSFGGIDTRGCSQFELSHIMYQIFGEPDVPL